jgi:hypothetical protein
MFVVSWVTRFWPLVNITGAATGNQTPALRFVVDCKP